MRTAIILAVALVGAGLAVVPTAAAWSPWCASQNTSAVNWVQDETTCKVDRVQEYTYDLYCDLACP